MPIVESGTVDSEDLEEGAVRVDRWACEHFLRLPSRKAARKACKRGDLRLNDEPVESSRFVQPGDTVTLRAEDVERPPNELVPEVVHADDHFAIVIKPAGVLTNGARYRTLERGLPNAMKRSPEVDALAAPRPVHRLDYETWGLVAVARTQRSLVALGHAFEERRVHKTYRAVVAGRLEGEGVVDTPLDGRPAVSRYRVVGHTRSLKVGWITEVELHPETGRTHQLRRHLHELGHPILGDARYVDGPVLRKRGLFLAAVGLALDHPTTGEPLSFRVDPPHKFPTFLAHQVVRWNKFHPDAPVPLRTEPPE